MTHMKRFTHLWSVMPSDVANKSSSTLWGGADFYNQSDCHSCHLVSSFRYFSLCLPIFLYPLGSLVTVRFVNFRLLATRSNNFYCFFFPHVPAVLKIVFFSLLLLLQLTLHFFFPFLIYCHVVIFADVSQLFCSVLCNMMYMSGYGVIWLVLESQRTGLLPTSILPCDIITPQ